MIKRPLNERFGPKVLDLIKFTTIRDKPWPIGVPIMLYHWSGKPYASPHQNLAPVEVVDTTPIHIGRTAMGSMFYMPNRRIVTGPLWACEGFDSEEEMHAWFSLKIKEGRTVMKHLMRFALLEGGRA